MATTSDITVNAAAFNDASIGEDMKGVKEFIRDNYSNAPNWWHVGAPKYREMHLAGEISLPKPVYLEGARDATLPSRDAGRSIPIRVYKPDNGQPSKGVLVHSHGGGWVFGSHKYGDARLQLWANACQVTAVSVGYRLAPEDPYPAALHDCIDAITYLVDHAEAEYGAELQFVCGESGGATLSALTIFHLMRERPTYRLSGAVLLYGSYDLSWSLPQPTTIRNPLVIDREALERYGEAWTPGLSAEERKDPLVSALYEDMQGLAASSPYKSLPPALFVCGSDDILLDDTLLMGTKWMATGSEACVKIYPGAPHAFDLIPGIEASEEAVRVTCQFMEGKLEAPA